MTARSLLSSGIEFFVLRDAERAIRGYTPAQHEHVALSNAAGDRRLLAARRTSDPLAACLLLRASILSYLRAAEFARDAEVSESSLDPDALAARIPTVPLDPVLPDAEADGQRVARAIASPDPLFFDRLRRDELERTRSALDRTAPVVGGMVESRSLTHLRAARVGRWVGALLLVSFVLLRVGRAEFWPNLAYGKRVTGSSVAVLPDLQGLVDGEIGTSYGAATLPDNDAWIQVDLQDRYALTAIKVYNRVDGWVDDSLPLVLQTSLNGTQWDDVGRRDTSFGASPPWTVQLAHKPARFVRVHGVGHTAVVLSELEVFGKRW